MLLIRGPTRRIGPHSMQGVARRVVADIKRGSQPGVLLRMTLEKRHVF